MQQGQDAQQDGALAQQMHNNLNLSTTSDPTTDRQSITYGSVGGGECLDPFAAVQAQQPPHKPHCHLHAAFGTTRAPQPANCSTSPTHNITVVKSTSARFKCRCATSKLKVACLTTPAASLSYSTCHVRAQVFLEFCRRCHPARWILWAAFVGME